MIPALSALTADAFKHFRCAQKAGHLPYYIVLFLTIYLPFEDFLLKWLPIPSQLLALLRFGPEIIIWGLLFQIIWHKKSTSKQLVATPIDIPLAAFFISATISIIINGSAPVASIMALRAIWRYVPLYYILVNIDISLNQVSFILRAIRTTAIVQTFLSALQSFMPPSFNKIFAPKSVGLGEFEKNSGAEGGELKVGATFGTFDNPAALSSFLLVGIVIFMTLMFFGYDSQLLGLKNIINTVGFYFGIYATKKRASLVLALLIPIVILFFKGNKRSIIKTLWLYSTMAFIAILYFSLSDASVDTSFSGVAAREESIDPASYFLQIFSADYWSESSSSSRGWVMTTITNAVIDSKSWFGFGPDLDVARETIRDILIDGEDRRKILDLEPVEDIYWIALIAYYGFLGLGIYLTVIFRLFSVARQLKRYSSFEEYKILGTTFCTLVFITLFYSFVERILKIRGFSYYFWLLAGLVVNAWNVQKGIILRNRNQHRKLSA